MKIAIIGTGAVGGYFGAKLATAGNEVHFLARGQQLAAIQENGIKVKSILGDFEVYPVKTTDRIQELGVSDLIILAVKAWQIREVRKDLTHLLHDKSIILPLQNGVLAANEIQESINPRHIIGGVCRIISKLEKPGFINHFGATPSIVFGELKQTNFDRLAKIKLTFDAAGIESRIAEHIQTDIWKKFGFICVGGLMAVTRATLGEIREYSETRAMLNTLVGEVSDLSSKVGVDLGTDFKERTLKFIDSLPPATTFSMARDIWDARPSELDYLNGAVVMLADKYQIPVPINRFIYNSLKINELRSRSS